MESNEYDEIDIDTEDVVQTLQNDIEKVKKERLLLQQKHCEEDIKPSTFHSITQEEITTASSKISTFLRQNGVADIDYIAYPDNCYMVDIRLLEHALNEIVNNNALKEEIRMLSDKVEQLSNENRELIYNSQSDAKVHELESTVNALQAKIESQDMQDRGEKTNNSILYDQIEEKQSKIEDIHTKLIMSEKKNKDLETTIMQLKSPVFMEGKYKEALMTIECLQEECTNLKQNMESHLEEIDSLNKLNARLSQSNRELLNEARTNKAGKDHSECEYLRKVNTQLNDRNNLLEGELKNTMQGDSKDMRGDSYYKKIVDECCQIMNIPTASSLITSLKKINKLVSTMSNMEAYIKQIQQLVESENKQEKCDMKTAMSIIKNWKTMAKTSNRVIEVLTKIKELLFNTNEKKDIEDIYSECANRLEQYGILLEYQKTIEQIYEGELSEALMKEMEACQQFRKDAFPYVQSFMETLQDQQMASCLETVSDLVRQKYCAEPIKI